MTTKIPHNEITFKRNVRGKKTKNPGWKAGNHWVNCDRCNAHIRAKDAMITWDNYVVCPDDWEVRHPQDFVRGRQDKITPDEPIRPENEDVFVSTTKFATSCTTNTPIPGNAVPGCAIPQSNEVAAPTSFSILSGPTQDDSGEPEYYTLQFEYTGVQGDYDSFRIYEEGVLADTVTLTTSSPVSYTTDPYTPIVPIVYPTGPTPFVADYTIWMVSGGEESLDSPTLELTFTDPNYL